jgi:hypothetical protein
MDQIGAWAWVLFKDIFHPLKAGSGGARLAMPRHQIFDDSKSELGDGQKLAYHPGVGRKRECSSGQAQLLIYAEEIKIVSGFENLAVANPDHGPAATGYLLTGKTGSCHDRATAGFAVLFRDDGIDVDPYLGKFV